MWKAWTYDKAGAGIAGNRREGYDKQYGYSGTIKGAYGIFFFRSPSVPGTAETEGVNDVYTG